MKRRKTIFVMGLLILIGFYLFLRLNNFEIKANYFFDQGLHLLESFQMVSDRKIRLIGPMATSKTFLDRGFFIGPQYYYVLAFLGILTKWNPISIDLILLFTELGFILYFTNWIRKKYGEIEALSIFGIITFSRYFIIHSRFFWNPHFLILLGILIVIILDRYIKTNKVKNLIVVGLLWGLAFGFHYSAVFWGIPLLIILIKNKKFWNKNTFIWLPIGFILGDLPWFVFEIRNNFYNIKTILWVMSQPSSNDHFELYYIIHPLGIFIFWGLAWLLNKIKNKKILIGLVLVLGISLLQIEFIKNPSPLTHPVERNYLMQKMVVEKILRDGCPNKFNVASTLSGDTRSYDLRFLLTRDGCKPMGVEKYPSAEKLFLVAPVGRPPENETVWEVSSLGKFKVNRQEKLTEKIVFWELEKN